MDIIKLLFCIDNIVLVAVGFAWLCFGAFARTLGQNKIGLNWDFWRKRLAAICYGIIALRLAVMADFLPEGAYVALAVLFGYFPDLALHWIRSAKDKANRPQTEAENKNYKNAESDD